MVTVFSSENSSMTLGPSSLPRPLLFTPPEGREISDPAVGG